MRFVSVLTSSSRGGAEFAAASMLDALIESGHEAVLLTDQPEIGRGIGIPTESIALGPKLSKRTYRKLSMTWPMQLRPFREALASQAPYDVLIVHYKKEQFLASMLPHSLRRTLLWAEWGPVPLPMRKGLPRLVYLSAAQRASAVMAVSAGTGRSVADVGVPARKIAVVPNAVRSDEIGFSPAGRKRIRAELGIPEDAFVVGCISRLHPKKRNDVVIDAVRKLGDRAHLIMAGEGEAETELRQQASAIEGRAHFIPTPTETIAEVLSAFDVSVFCPSPTEGAPRAVIIAMLAERPCLATGSEGVADMIDPSIGGISKPENDPRALAELIRPYLDEGTEITSQGKAARRLAIQRYSPEAVASQIEMLVAATGSARIRRIPKPWAGR